ncbi:hypothetical protein FKK50_27505 [Klebsiella pneumoniae]|nr:hypothetical protein [Klebsiella pneumoniae]
MPALAQNGSWTVSEVKGGVTIVDARGERAAVVGAQLAPGTTVRTEMDQPRASIMVGLRS